MAKAKSANNDAGFEQSLWDTANRLRGSVESSEYKHIVLSLIFLKFNSDMFKQRRAELVAQGQEQYVDMVEFYTMKTCFTCRKNRAGARSSSTPSRRILRCALIRR